MAQTPPLEIKKQLAPTLDAFQVAVHCATVHCAALSREGARPMISLLPHLYAPISTITHFFLSHLGAKVNTIRLKVDEPLGAEVAPLPAIVLGPTVGLKLRYRRR